MTLLERVVEAKFPYPEEIIHLFVGGSELHGAKVEGANDLDIYGVFVEPPHKILGIDSYEHFVWSTNGTDKKNGAGDVDITLYGLQRWAGLACKGNPTVLQFLFAPNSLNVEDRRDTWFKAVMSQRQAFLCQTHYRAFIGFATAQLMRMTGERSRNVTRPDLVKKHGYDTKFALHVIRLFAECEELLRTGVMTFPSPEVKLLQAIRNGEKTEEWVLREATRRMDLCEKAAKASPLKPEVDRNAVSKTLAEAYRMHWQKWRL